MSAVCVDSIDRFVTALKEQSSELTPEQQAYLPLAMTVIESTRAWVLDNPAQFLVLLKTIQSTLDDIIKNIENVFTVEME